MTEMKNAMVFPRDRVFEIGSIAVFCCLVPAGKQFIKMHLDDYNDSDTNITMISSQIYAMTVQLNQASKRSCTNVYCNADGKVEGACAYIGCKYDRNL